METQTASLNFVREVAIRYVGPRRRGPILKNSADAVTFFRTLLTDNVREHFIALYLDASHQVASYSLVSLGTANMAPVHPREVFQRAVLTGACAVILAHNHPSGNLEPSDEDRIVTKKLVDAGKLLGIPILDHLILSDSGFTSMAELGFIA